MESDTQRIKEFLQIVFLASICSIILGFLFFRSDVFQMTHPAFGFIAFGLIGSITFGALKMFSPSRALAALLFLLVVNEVLTKPPEVTLFLRDVLFTIGLGAAIFLFHRLFYIQISTMPMARSLILGSLTAISATVFTVVLNLLLIAFFEPLSSDLLHAISVNLMIGFLVGVGLGVGFEIAAKITAHVPNYQRASNANGG